MRKAPTLNAAQARAVSFGDGAPSGPLLIIAGAGTGKTNTLAHRVAHLVVKGADARRILLMTFSRRAALELERRAGRLVEAALGLPARERAVTLPWSGTFHSVAARLLREYAPRIGMAPGFSILDRGDSVEMMGMARHELGHSQSHRRFPEKTTCVAIHSRVVNSVAPLKDILDAHYPWCAEWHDELHQLFATYARAKDDQNLLDYDDLLLYWQAMAEEPELARELGGRFDHVLIDEYQDTNRVQAAILQALWPLGRGLTVVGDDAQSIYSFRAATVRNILDFPAQFLPPATVIALEENYRSSPAILAACNAVIAQAREGFRKELVSSRPQSSPPRLVTVRDEADEANYIADGVLTRRETGMALRDQAVLFRTAHHSTMLELELVRRNIPFVKFGGLKFLEAAHVKDVLAFLRFAENPQNRLAAARAIQILPQVGPATTARLMAALPRITSARTALEAVVPQSAARADWQALASLLAQLEDNASWPRDLERVLEWYRPHLARRSEDAEVRWLDLEQLLQVAPAYGTRQRFITELTLDPPEAVSDLADVPHLDEDYLILSTIHSAKGQEWRAVSVMRVVDGAIPSDMACSNADEIEEERRLLYVAMTRARDELELLIPQRFYVHHQMGRGDQHVYALRTRFLPESILGSFELASWPRSSGDASSAVLEAHPVALGYMASAAPADVGKQIDIRQRVRGRWNTE